MPAKILIQGQNLDVTLVDGMALITKEDLLAAAKTLSTTEQHWLYMQLARHIDGALDAQ